MTEPTRSDIRNWIKAATWYVVVGMAGAAGICVLLNSVIPGWSVGWTIIVSMAWGALNFCFVVLRWLA